MPIKIICGEIQVPFGHQDRRAKGAVRTLYGPLLRKTNGFGGDSRVDVVVEKHS